MDTSSTIVGVKRKGNQNFDVSILFDFFILGNLICFASKRALTQSGR